MFIQSVSCANAECAQLSLDIAIGELSTVSSSTGRKHHVSEWDEEFDKTILPEVRLTPVPSDVPREIAITYREAVLTAEISGRASAAMSRRCLQGIVRDFFNLPQNKRGNLGAELSYVRDQIDPNLWDAIQAVRSVGDSGAHMDNNVDHIIDISSDEAHLLIGLIETLFKEWYDARTKRNSATNALKALLENKRGQQKEAKKQAAKKEDQKDSDDSAAAEVDNGST
ncbi:DUF4145 domain-containing protein [Rhizobium leguminosarum]|uniref:DUF4145 domain-containing protein n=1 Tax=Rhizobium leguminosarum TaxID=384 RepID=UPI001C97AC9E|nr:DUF4145 domain-containing protein [Rhizobium leguminosarum]MBY5395341.1 DUF4145 domain-containing protein [Rhizobium leguminosarum]